MSVVLVWGLAVCSLSRGGIIYVDDDASTGGDGLSWATAYRFLQDALAVAEPNAWDVALYEIVLSGDLAGDDVLEADPCDLVEDPNEGYWARPSNLTYWCLLMESTRKENCLHVVDASGAREETATLDGFTICGGQSFNPPYWLTHINFDNYDYGGGIFNEGGKLCLRSCVITENASIADGPGIYCKGGTLELIDCCMTANYSHYSGQCMGNDDSEVLIKGCLFEEYFPYPRRSAAEGWIINYDGSLEVTDCRFLNHSEFDEGTTIKLDNSTAVFDQCVFSGHVEGVIEADTNLVITRSWFENNRGSDGVAIKVASSGHDFLISSSVFVGNQGGTTVYAFSSRLENIKINNCVFSENNSPYRGGGIQCDANVIVSNCIFWHNYAPLGSDIYMYESDLTYNSLESIISLECHESCSTSYLEGNGNVFGDPCFVDPGYWDVNDTPDDPNDDFYVSGNYHLKSQAGHWDPNSESWVCDDVTSPCIDTGSPNSPIMYEPFPNGGVVNIGAYGGTVEASRSYFGKPVCETIIAGDINGDGRVDHLDLAILSGHWLEQGDEEYGDTRVRD